MKKSLVFLLVLSLCGCSLFRKVHKESQVDQTISRLEVKKDSNALTIDRSVISVQEKIDTVIIVPGKEVNQDTYLNMDSLVNGITAIKNELIDVRLILHPVTGILSASASVHAVKVPVNIDRVTNVKMDVTRAGNKSETVAHNNKSVHKTDTVDRDIKNIPWFILLVIGIIIVIRRIFAMYNI